MSSVKGSRVLWCSGALVLVLGFAKVHAQIDMPDPSIIHGRALPAPELAAGTVTVRVVREAIGNDIEGQQVQLTAGGATRTARTDAEGRAQFDGLAPGAQASARATVDGEELVSQPFAVAASGGVRVILVAGLEAVAARREAEATAAATAPAVPGVVVFGGNSRILMEFQDDELSVFYVLEILNSARARVDIGGPITIDLPEGASAAGILQGSVPTATVQGDRVIVPGPFAAGTTSLQIGFRMIGGSSRLTFEQTFPVAMEQMQFAVQKVGDLSATSSQFESVREVTSENGTPFLLASGPALPAGGTLSVELTGLPAHGRTARYVTLGLSALILGTGAWLAFGGRQTAERTRRQLVARRDTLLGELAALDARQPRPDYASGRQTLLQELEAIYGELDDASSDSAA